MEREEVRREHEAKDGERKYQISRKRRRGEEREGERGER